VSTLVRKDCGRETLNHAYDNCSRPLTTSFLNVRNQTSGEVIGRVADGTRDDRNPLSHPLLPLFLSGEERLLKTASVSLQGKGVAGRGRLEDLSASVLSKTRSSFPGRSSLESCAL